MLHYILQTIVFQLLFLVVYDLFLKRETFFNYNRIYLLSTGLLSLILPFIQMESFKNIVTQKYRILLPEVILGDANNVNAITVVNQDVYAIWNYILYIGICIAAFVFAYKIIQIIRLIIDNQRYKKGNLIVVRLKESNTAFSFFNYVFLGEDIEEKDHDAIFKHEQIHVLQKHTLDLLFFEILRILFWYNPMVYMYQNRIANVHEFIADKKAAKNNNKKYYENLLSQIFNVKQISLVNPFFKQSLIKKRIVMLQKSKSKKRNLIKYAMLLPVLACMLIYTSCSQEEGTAVPLDQDMEQVVEKFRNQLQTENSTLTKAERLELAEYIIDEFKANVEDNGKTSSGSISASSITSSDEVPFSVIENVPVFPGCEGEVDNKERKKCMAGKISNFVNKNFNIGLAQELGLKSGKHRISVQFIVDKNGDVVDVKARAPHPKLEVEAIRIVSLLPKMKPGMHLGKAVSVPYGFPIQFQINE
ncbi:MULTISPECIES: M56 family metallopeptidase [unclassified Lacinutrix]